MTFGYGANAGTSAFWVDTSDALTLAQGEAFTLEARCSDPGVAHEAWIAVKAPDFAGGALADPNLSALQRVIELDQFDYEFEDEFQHGWNLLLQKSVSDLLLDENLITSPI